MNSRTYRQSYQSITRKTNPVMMHEMSNNQLLEHIVGSGAAVLLEYVNDNPHVFSMKPSEMLRLLANIPNVGYTAALRFTCLHIYCGRQRM